MEYFQIKMDLLINDIQRLEGKTGEETINDDDSRYISDSGTMHTEGGEVVLVYSRFSTWFGVFMTTLNGKL